MIRVTANVNGKATHFVLDNGCPYLVINSRYWKNGVQQDSAVKARGVGGEVNAGAVLIDSFNWEGVQKQHFKAIAADLPHLGDSIGGLMGLDVYKDYRVTFDFKSRQILFEKPETGVEIEDSISSRVIVPFVFSGHMPVVTCTIEQEKIQMGIDCAAFPNLVSAKLLSTMKEISNVRNTILRGAGAPVTVVEANIKELLIGDVSYRDMRFTFDNSSLSQINQGRDIIIDGLLGMPFLKQHKTVIDFLNRRVEIYRDK
nr:pepsin/retropepsin-like aspartic protease family protein [Niabella hibiscisoli]